MDDALRLLAVLGLVAGNAFFVASEYAVVTARRGELAARRGARAASALRLMDDPVRVISTVQVMITAIGILTGAIGEPLVRDLLGGDLPAGVSFGIAFAIVTYLTVVLGELVPKALALDRATTLILLIAPPIELLGRLLHPLVVIFERSATLVLRPFGIREVVAGEGIRSPEELRAIVDEVEGAGVIPRSQEELLHNVLDFGAREARDAMVLADEVAWLDAAWSPAEALARLMDGWHTRLPVGEGSLDRMVGIVHARDVVAAARAGSPATVGELVRDAMVVPETKELGVLLREMRERRQQLAAVAGEYGDVLGIVTLEDVLERLVGQIEDEFDVPADRIDRVDERTTEVAGTMTVDELNETLDIELPTEVAHTVAGVLFAELGRLPEPGDEVVVGGVRLGAVEVDGQRIRRVRVLRF